MIVQEPRDPVPYRATLIYWPVAHDTRVDRRPSSGAKARVVRPYKQYRSVDPLCVHRPTARLVGLIDTFPNIRISPRPKEDTTP